MLATILFSVGIRGTTITVGDGKSYSRLEEAMAAAADGSVIEVYPRATGYGESAVLVTKPRVTFRGMGPRPIRLDGGGFEYRGSGKTPRAIFQIEPNGQGATIENFELTGAHNGSFNGAGVRINAASGVSIKGCDIHGCDMGIMSNGIEGDPTAGSDQLIDHCRIHENGNAGEAGFNHNLYLGGTSVTVQFCEIFRPLTGHNLKSRAHFNLVQYCSIHDSQNRELDFVDSWDTMRPNSNVVLLGNLIRKDVDCPGNHETIHFGRESGSRDGTIYLVNNTVFTSFSAPMLELTATTPRAELSNNIFLNPVKAAILVQTASPSETTGKSNWLSGGYSGHGLGLVDSATGPIGLEQLRPALNPQYRDGRGVLCPARPAFRFDEPAIWVKSDEPRIGVGQGFWNPY